MDMDRNQMGEALEDAEETLAQHSEADDDGTCYGCGYAAPCREERSASAMLRLRDMLLAMPDGPDGDAYTDYCTGADGTKKQPYPQRRNRQCSIGYHEECTDPAGERCGCPCHKLYPAPGEP